MPVLSRGTRKSRHGTCWKVVPIQTQRFGASHSAYMSYMRIVWSSQCQIISSLWMQVITCIINTAIWLRIGAPFHAGHQKRSQINIHLTEIWVNYYSFSSQIRYQPNICGSTPGPVISTCSQVRWGRSTLPRDFMAVWLPLIFGTFKNPALQPATQISEVENTVERSGGQFW